LRCGGGADRRLQRAGPAVRPRRRLRFRWAFLIGVVLIGLGRAGRSSTGSRTSPSRPHRSGRPLPDRRRCWAWLVAVPIAALLAVGLAGVGGISLESAMRRASLVGQLRFALTVRDLRTVVRAVPAPGRGAAPAPPLIVCARVTGQAGGLETVTGRACCGGRLSRFVRVARPGRCAGAACGVSGPGPRPSGGFGGRGPLACRDGRRCGPGRRRWTTPTGTACRSTRIAAAAPPPCGVEVVTLCWVWVACSAPRWRMEPSGGADRPRLIVRPQSQQWRGRRQHRPVRLRHGRRDVRLLRPIRRGSGW